MRDENLVSSRGVAGHGFTGFLRFVLYPRAPWLEAHVDEYQNAVQHADQVVYL